MTSLGNPLHFNNGSTIKNRFMLAALTNLQSGTDGVMSDDEYHWLTRRAEGGFGLTMTCATSVQHRGVGFPGQLGAHDDLHLEGLKRMASGIKAQGSHAVVQLHHGGMRAMGDYCDDTPMCPSDDESTNSKAMTIEEVEGFIEDCIASAVRCHKAGFDGVQLHGAHGYLIAQFLSPEINRRDDAYGGSPVKRAKVLFDIIEGINASCGRSFSLGVRLSPERFGQRTEEIRDLAGQLLTDDRIDYLDMSLWDVFKPAHDEAFAGESLLKVFTDLPRKGVALGAAGKLYSAGDCQRAIDSGLDFVLIGRGAVVHADFPAQAMANPDFAMLELPVSRQHLADQGLGPKFIDYMASWKGFVAA
jgi:2,4-dienoyl-CoA reductase-like NADH-dependent reductase (Old Yellow Enzyme family)